MYLSRVQVDTNNRRKLKTLTHLGAYHNWVEQAFPNEVANGERGRHLWRIDRLKGDEYLLVLSEEKPDLNLLECFGKKGTAESKNYDSFLNSIVNGQSAYFRLTANPTISIPKPGQPRGTVYPILANAKQRAWLIKKIRFKWF